MKFGDELFFLMVSLHARLNSHCEGWSYKKKKKKMTMIEESCIERTQGKKFSINSRLKAI